MNVRFGANASGDDRLHITQSTKRHKIFREPMPLDGEHFYILSCGLDISSCGMFSISATTVKGERR